MKSHQATVLAVVVGISIFLACAVSVALVTYTVIDSRAMLNFRLHLLGLVSEIENLKKLVNASSTFANNNVTGGTEDQQEDLKRISVILQNRLEILERKNAPLNSSLVKLNNALADQLMRDLIKENVTSSFNASFVKMKNAVTDQSIRVNASLEKIKNYFVFKLTQISNAVKENEYLVTAQNESLIELENTLMERLTLMNDALEENKNQTAFLRASLQNLEMSLTDQWSSMRDALNVLNGNVTAVQNVSKVELDVTLTNKLSSLSDIIQEKRNLTTLFGASLVKMANAITNQLLQLRRDANESKNQITSQNRSLVTLVNMLSDRLSSVRQAVKENDNQTTAMKASLMALSDTVAGSLPSLSEGIRENRNLTTALKASLGAQIASLSSTDLAMRKLLLFLTVRSPCLGTGYQKQLTESFLALQIPFNASSRHSCQEYKNMGFPSGTYMIDPQDSQPGFCVYCDMDTDGGGWTVLQRRIDGTVDFYRNWTEYRKGFGDITSNFWLGNDKFHRLTKAGLTHLRVDLGDWENRTVYAKYTNFMVGDAASNYVLQVSGYSGTANDGLGVHNGQQFSTYDADHDKSADSNCASSWHGAWWYTHCYASNLNGLYASGSNASYVVWYSWQPKTGLKFAEMKVR